MNLFMSNQDHQHESVLPPKTSFTITSNATGTMPSPLSGRRGVPLSLPLPFLLTGVCAAALFGLLLPWIVPEALQSPAFPHVLTLVHLATLGWLTMTIMGASFQLLPVMIVAPLRATRFIAWQYPLYLGGVVLLLSGFWWFSPLLMAIGGMLIVLAVIQFVVVLGSTLAHATKRPLTIRFLVASLIYLCCVVSLGLTAALNFQYGFLGANLNQLLLTHITLGVVGWLSSTLIGISYTLVRLFALAHEHDDRIGKIIFVLLNASIIGLATGFLLSWLLLLGIAGSLLTVTVWLFAYDYWRMLHVRRRKLLDVTQYHGIAAVAYVCIVMPLGLIAILSGWQPPSVLTALTLLALIGWLGQSITGYLYKIVPFLIWHERYGPLVGRQKVPLMRDMIHQRWAMVSFCCINGGVAGMSLAAFLSWVLPLQLAGGLLGVGLVLAAINVIGVLIQ